MKYSLQYCSEKIYLCVKVWTLQALVCVCVCVCRCVFIDASASGENCRWFLLSPWQPDLHNLNNRTSLWPQPHTNTHTHSKQRACWSETLQGPNHRHTLYTTALLSHTHTHTHTHSHTYPQSSGFLGNSVYPVHLVHLAACPISINLPSVYSAPRGAPVCVCDWLHECD